jgi:hypothetical protein
MLLCAVCVTGAAAAAAEPPERATSVIVYGDDRCPPATTEDEIVVCARRPEGERYRIPKELRNAGDRPSEVSWGARTQVLEEAARETRPGSCSPVGSYGQSGCAQQMVRDWYEARRARRR